LKANSDSDNRFHNPAPFRAELSYDEDMTRNALPLVAALSLAALGPAPLGLGTALAATTPVAPSTVITKVTPDLMLSIVQGAGFTAKLDKSGDNPEITLTRKGLVDIFISLHDCKSGSCSEADAYTYYAAEDLDTAPEESDMTAWNRDNYSQAYIDSEDDDSVNLDSLYLFKGGFTKANFVNWLNKFKSDADDFDQMLKDL
jgi:hypothetical protein